MVYICAKLNRNPSMKFLLFDDLEIAPHLAPFTFTRPIANIRLGIFTMAERWAKMLNQDVLVSGSNNTLSLFPIPEDLEDTIWINAAWIPNEKDVSLVMGLKKGESIVKDSTILSVFTHRSDLLNNPGPPLNPTDKMLPEAELLTRPWEIFSKNGRILRSDFDLVCKDRKSEEITDAHTVVYGKELIFLEAGVDIKAAILNASDGPIYIGKNVQIQEGAIIRGPFAILENSVVNMGAKIKPDTTVGPFCKVGGEISNAVFFGYSNKGHDGFLGNSVIGEWCNLGADTNNSNLKNNYSEVTIYSHATKQMVGTGLQFCGLLMGDHSKTAINSMLNTGTVVGVGCNIFDGGFPPKHVASFSWGGSKNGFEFYEFEKFIATEKKVFARRNKEMAPVYMDMLKAIFLEKRN